MPELTIDRKTAERMGYDDVVAAESVEVRGLLVELCLVRPGHAVSGDQYALVYHSDCDPDRPDRGFSSVETAGKDPNKAADAYLAALAAIRADAELPSPGLR